MITILFCLLFQRLDLELISPSGLIPRRAGLELFLEEINKDADFLWNVIAGRIWYPSRSFIQGCGIFFQCYMVAPLIPRLSEVFEIPAQEIALIVPAYMLFYALTALFYGLLSDRFGAGV